MSAQSSQRSIFRCIRVAGTPTISAHRASNAIGFFRAFEKRRASDACGQPTIDGAVDWLGRQIGIGLLLIPRADKACSH